MRATQGPLLKDYKGMRGSAQTPQYLKGISSNARAEAAVLWRFEALQEHSGNIAGIRGAVMNLSGRTLQVSAYCWQSGFSPHLQMYEALAILGVVSAVPSSQPHRTLHS